MAGHCSAGYTCVKPRTSGITARSTTRDFVGVSSDGGAATGRLDTETVLEEAEGLGAIAGTEVGEMGTRRGEDLRGEREIWVVEIGRHGKEGERLWREMEDGEEGRREEDEDDDGVSPRFHRHKLHGFEISTAVIGEWEVTNHCGQ